MKNLILVVMFCLISQICLANFMGGGGGSVSTGISTREIIFDATDLDLLETNAPAPSVYLGTYTKQRFLAFDTTTEEYATGKFMVPGGIDSSGTVTFRVYVSAQTAAASKNVGLTFAHLAINDSENIDQAYTDEDSGANAIDATQNDVTEITWTETVTNLGWAANDLVFFKLSRDVSVTDDLASDMHLFKFTVEIPRS